MQSLSSTCLHQTPRAVLHWPHSSNLRLSVLVGVQRRNAEAEQQAPISRRATLALTAALWLELADATSSPSASAQQLAAPQLLPGTAPAPLEQLLSPDMTAISNPGVSWAIGKRSKQLFYPEWMEGTWQFTASFVNVSFPQGQRLISRSTPGVTKASLIMSLADVGAGMEAPVQYTQRFVASTEQGGVVADRPFNIQQQVDAFLRYPAVQQVDYAPLDNPTRLAVIYKTPRKDASEISSDLRKAEIFINNRASGTTAAGAWVGWENYRQVNQARQQGSIGDYLAAWGISRIDDEHVAIRHRSVAFLQPQDPQYFEAGSAAVAVYDYQIAAEKLA